MHSVKYYDEHAGMWIRRDDDGTRRRSVTPLASPGAIASGLVVHRDTLQTRSPIATPRGTWLARNSSGEIERLDRTEYISIRTPRIPQPPIASHSVAGAHLSPQPNHSSAPASWLLAAPLSPPVIQQQRRPVTPAQPVIDVVYNEEAGRRHRDGDRVEDPQRPGSFITRQTLRHRADLVEDPQRAGHMITRRALQARRYLVEDPRRPGHYIRPSNLSERDTLVQDPNQPGHMISRQSLRRRENRVEDPQNPGQLITRDALRQRERKRR